MKLITIRVLQLIQLAALLLIVGCSNASTPSSSAMEGLMNGDLTKFLSKAITNYGGRLNLSEHPPGPITCSWRFRQDTNGFQIFTAGKLFADVDNFFRSTVGISDIATEKKPGAHFVVYNVRKAGVAITYLVGDGPFSDIPNPNLQIIVLKPNTLPF